MWTYVQKNGRLLDAKRRLISIGYSGHAEGKNNPALQSHANLGPIPCGTYTITAPFDSPDHGPYCLRLAADASNQMFARAGFLMHGDSVVHPGMASLGCIIQLHAIRMRVWESDDHRLNVVSGL
jgi:hypothetical protein